MKKKFSILLATILITFSLLPLVKTNASQRPIILPTKVLQLKTPNTIDLISSSQDTKAYIENFNVKASILTNTQSVINIPSPVYIDNFPTKIASINGSCFIINTKIGDYTLKFSSQESYNIGDTLALRSISYTITGNLVITDEEGNIISKSPVNKTLYQLSWTKK